MTTFKPPTEILKLIETVDPSDQKALNDIDARVWCLVKNVRFDKRLDDFVYCTPENGQSFATQITKYSRSRDALKGIRPEGWKPAKLLISLSLPDEYEFGLYNHVQDDWILSPPLPTEELAELAAILQAIAYERAPGEGL